MVDRPVIWPYGMGSKLILSIPLLNACQAKSFTIKKHLQIIFGDVSFDPVLSLYLNIR